MTINLNFPFYAFDISPENDNNSRKAKETIETFNKLTELSNQELKNEVEELQKKLNLNLQTSNSLISFEGKLENVLKSQSSHSENAEINEIDRNRIFSMMQIVPECEKLLQFTKIEKNDIFQNLQSEINSLQLAVDDKNKQILEMQKRINESDARLQQDNESYLKQVETCEKLSQEKMKSDMELDNLKKEVGIFKDSLENLKNGFQTLKILEEKSKNFGTMKEISTALIAVSLEPQYLKNIEESFQKFPNSSHFSVKLSKIHNFPGQDPQNNLHIEDFQGIDCVFVCSVGQFPSKLGDFLKTLHDQGKGIVLTEFCTRNDAYGICGAIESELPFEKGPQITGSDGPFFLQKIISNHSILKGVESFNGGKGSWRSKIKVKMEQSEEETISLVATWDDESHTPLIITKEFHKSQEKKGNIVILNFWPVSDKILLHFFWDFTTDGHKILQNSIFFASKNSQKLEELEKQKAACLNNIEKLMTIQRSQ